MILSTQTLFRPEVSPSRIAHAAKKRLGRSPYPSIRNLSCECDDQGVLFLRGRLPRFYLKQVAQEAVADIEGLAQVVNEVEVLTPADWALATTERM